MILRNYSYIRCTKQFVVKQQIMNNSKQNKPTESEMEILQVLWEQGPSTVREVHEILSRNERFRLYHYFKTDADNE